MVNSAKSIFSSARERRLWLWTLSLVLAIYLTLGRASSLAGMLRDRGIVNDAIWLVIWLIAATIITLGLKARPSGIEIGIGIGVLAVYILVFARMALPEDRSHLMEYGVVAAFIYQALLERQRNGFLKGSPAWLAFAITSLLGLLDEIIQAFLPNRYFDIRDVGFNALAPLMAVLAIWHLSLVRARFKR